MAAKKKTINNPYLREFKKTPPDAGWSARHPLVKKYAWAIHNDEAIDALVTISPLVEIGAGSGYWASLIKQAGGDIIAYDIDPPDKGRNQYGHVGSYLPIQKGGPTVLKKYADRSLFLCWPPYGASMADDCLRNWKGKMVAVVGEGKYGATADDAFWDALADGFTQEAYIDIPQWEGIHDYLSIWKRK